MNLLPYMPHVRSLAAAGASFQNYFVVDSLCCPSRSAIFTGQYPHTNGVFTNEGPDGGFDTYNRMGDPAKSFAVALHGVGYRTAFMGKYLNGYRPTDPPARGWDVWDVTGNGYPEYNYQLNESGTLQSYGHSPRDYLTDVLGRKAASFIRSTPRTGRPFALEVSTFAPHKPWIPARRDVGTYPTTRAPRGPTFDRIPANAPHWLTSMPPLSLSDEATMDVAFRRRVEDVQSVDRMIARLENVLAQTGQLHNTYFVFSSDNGYHMGEYRLLPGKQTAFDTDIRVPLIVAGPGVAAGQRVPELTSSIDLAPTFLQIGGASPTDQPDGVSLLGLLKGEPAPNWQRAVLIEHHGHLFVFGDPDRQPIRSGNPPSYEAMRTADYLYVEYVTGEREYYDLTTDPHEMDNIVSTLPAARLAALHVALRRLTICRGADACQRAARLSGAAVN
jgi:arylsulfatase A-like enzyme